MVYSIQQLTLLPESRNSRVYHKADSMHGQPVVVRIVHAAYPTHHQLSRYNNEDQFTRDPAIEAGWTWSFLSIFIPGAGRAESIQGGIP
jgi:hypothetical protein